MPTILEQVTDAKDTLVADAAIQHSIVNGGATETVTTEAGQVRTVANAIATLMATVPRGAWLTTTVYAVKDLVTQSGNVYICTLAHTAGTFATDLAAVKWALFAGPADEGSLASGFGRQRRRGTTAQHASFTGLLGELTMDTDLKTLRVHDGSMPGGFPVDYVVNVKRFGAKGDGVTDDTTAIQAALTATTKGRIFFPAGTYNFSSLSFADNNGCIELVGEGNQNTNQNVFGNAGWNYPAVKGTVLRSTAASGVALLLSSIKACNLRGIAIVGPGTGTAIGVKLTSGIGATSGANWSDVLIANFAQGLDMNAALDCSFMNCDFLGCTLGVKMVNASNQNVFVNCHFQESTTKAVWVNASADVCFYCCLFQNYSGVAVYIDGAGNQIHVENSYFESAHANTDAINIQAGSAHTITKNHFSSLAGSNNADVVRIDGGGGYYFANNLAFNDSRIVGNGGMCFIFNDGMPVDAAFKPYVKTTWGSDGHAVNAHTDNGGVAGRVESVTGDATPIMTRRFWSALNANSDWINGLAVNPAYAYGDGALFWRNNVTGIPFIMKKDGTFLASRFAFGGTDAQIYTGTGTPEGVVTAFKGSIFLRSDGGAGTMLYCKESGNNTNTGWVGK